MQLPSCCQTGNEEEKEIPKHRLCVLVSFRKPPKVWRALVEKDKEDVLWLNVLKLWQLSRDLPGTMLNLLATMNPACGLVHA